MTEAMDERKKTLHAEWKDEGDGYFSMTGQSPSLWMSGPISYIALPEGHPAIGDDYDSHDPDVNGGLTYSKDNVFGWDYMHAFNTYDIVGDIRNALEYFRKLKGD